MMDEIEEKETDNEETRKYYQAVQHVMWYKECVLEWAMSVNVIWLSKSF